VDVYSMKSFRKPFVSSLGWGGCLFSVSGSSRCPGASLLHIQGAGVSKWDTNNQRVRINHLELLGGNLTMTRRKGRIQRNPKAIKYANPVVQIEVDRCVIIS
jgi:hypothetical protein